jgi:hypothetical protein
VIGVQTFTLKSARDGDTLDRKGIPCTEYVSTVLPGCLLQPDAARENVTNIDYTESTYKLVSEPFPAALGSKADDLVVDDSTGTVYRVLGIIVYPGPNGLPHHVVMNVVVPSGLDAVTAAPESPQIIDSEEGYS